MPFSDKYKVLKKYFGYNSFRAGQEEIIDCILSHRDVLAVMPTGAGKSVCYQLPAVMMDGITLVISPLISLMNDQVTALTQLGINAAYINSTMSFDERRITESKLRRGKYKLLYTAPERLLNPMFIDLCRDLNIKLIAVDEAHCVSQWGHNFRPSYLDIREFINCFPNRPVVAAFTATATEKVKADIRSLLGLNNPYTLTTGYDRPNLKFSVISEPENKLAVLVSLVKERSNRSGIIYCSTRGNAEMIKTVLQKHNVSAEVYHAGLADLERAQAQDRFIKDEISVMCATNAFGMGIDKSNVSYVIHYNIPKDIESYYQEAGRAGRDGSQAECILIYTSEDAAIQNYLIDHGETNEMLSKTERLRIRMNEHSRLKAMEQYCRSKSCLRGLILEYFGEKPVSFCGGCSNCINLYTNADITTQAQMIMSCIVRMKQQYGKSLVADVLAGKASDMICRFGFDRLSTYGILSDYTRCGIELVIDTLIEKGYIEIFGDENPVLKLTDKAKPVLYGNERVTVADNTNSADMITAGEIKLTYEDYQLYKKLAALRKKISDSVNIPPYALFSDTAIADMCKKKPKNLQEFSKVIGVGRLKLEKYGRIFLQEINK